MADDNPNSVMIDRVFNAPVEIVWQMWTVPDHFRSWFGPTGATVPMAKMDLRVGGARSHCMEMQTPDGPMQMWFSGEFMDVVENERLVYTEAATDPNGVPLDASHAVTEVRVELTAVEGGTRVVMTHAGIPAGSPGEAGWVMALDKLAVVLAA